MNQYNKKMAELLKTAFEIDTELEKEGKKLINSDILQNFGAEVDIIRRGNEAEEESEERNLRIGIVGEMKAGKSSFLNALIFDGVNYLPKAPTPMTAVLTIIGYSKQPHAEVCYYTKKDWELISQQEESYQEHLNQFYNEAIKLWNESNLNVNDYVEPMPDKKKVEILNSDNFSEQEKSGHELYTKIKENNLQVEEYINKNIKLQGDDLLKQLDNYVGSKGTHTPLVKYVKIYLDKEVLKGLEIIDTPGLNDPVISRSNETRKNLERCDVVFMLSRSGQFFTEQDVQFLKVEAAKVNIKKAVLVATQLDAGMKTFPSRRKISFEEMYDGTKDSNTTHAKNTLKKQVTDTNAPQILKELYRNDIYFVSSFFYQAAKELENGKIVDTYVKEALENLEIRCTDFAIDNLTPEDLMEVAGFNEIKKDILKPLYEEKEKIIAEKLAERCDTAVANLVNALEDINRNSISNLDVLENSDMDKLQSGFNKMKKQLDGARSKTQHAFNQGAVQAEKNIFATETSISKALDNHTDLQRYIREVTVHWKTGWIFKDDHYRTEHIPYVKVADVLINAHNYRAEIADIADRDFELVFDLDKIKNEVKQAVLQAFDTSKSDFNSDVIIIPLEDVLSKLKLTPAALLDMEKYDNLLNEMVKGPCYETDEGIAELANIQFKVLQELEKEAKGIIASKKEEIRTLMKTNAGSFIDKISESAQENMVKIQQQMQNKEESIKQHKLFQKLILHMKQRLIAFL